MTRQEVFTHQRGCIAARYDGGFVQRRIMNIHLSIGPLAALIAGILILIAPRLLNFIVALYLILIGVLGLFGNNMHLH